uniref:cAMP and cAMP-inhibited cGMP 3',5'-cyclic phosphodiesterase 10A n=1 Tax=Culex pipiens TaxID=7175 RepID=A0A8D8K5F9_CULPI
MDIITRFASSFAGLWRNRRRPQNEDAFNNRIQSNHDPEITAHQVKKYLQANPDFLDGFVMDEIQLEQLERWMIRKTQRTRKVTQTEKNGRKTSLSRWKFCVHADKRQMLQDLIHSLQLRPTKMHVLWELANCICSAVNADGFRLYLTDATEAESLHLCLSNSFIDENGDPKPLQIKSDAVLPNYVAKVRENLRLSRGDVDHRFPRDLLDRVFFFICTQIYT